MPVRIWNYGLSDFDRTHILKFNWLNHPNWGGATTSPTSGTFGKVSSKSGERVLQISLRYRF
ncbi:MAG: hypothetical protein Q8N47_25705 [Bryobacterales bacterium]|nr:hypothetical protein [Bryobacterales bacterium]